MKNMVLRSFAMAGLIFMLAGASLQAQTSSKIVNIPFDFAAGTAKLKAGDYIVKRMSEHAVAIRSADGKTTALINAPLSLGARDSKPGARLVFNRYGDQYFLSQVWLRVDAGSQLFVSNEETKTAKAFRLARRKALPARVEVALRTT